MMTYMCGRTLCRATKSIWVCLGRPEAQGKEEVGSDLIKDSANRGWG